MRRAPRAWAIEPLSEADVHALLGACNRGATGDRNRALIAVLFYAGLRIAEALALRTSDLDAEARQINVRRGKGARQRMAGMAPAGWAHVEPWLAARKAKGLSSRPALFTTLTGSPVSQAYVRGMLRRLAQIAGLDKRVHAHGMRHSHAYQLANRGVPVHAIQRQLGHRSLHTTTEYVEHLSAGDVADHVAGAFA